MGAEMKRLFPLIALALLTAATHAADTPQIENQKSKIVGSENRPAPSGFLFTTFKGEQSPLTEQIYFGLSADGFHWSDLNDSKPVLVSTLGEKGVRDPYLLRTPFSPRVETRTGFE